LVRLDTGRRGRLRSQDDDAHIFTACRYFFGLGLPFVLDFLVLPPTFGEA